MTASERDLVAPEGVDEGSAASTTEDEQTGSGDVLGTRGTGIPENPEQDAGPVDATSKDTRVPQPGQQSQVGEG